MKHHVYLAAGAQLVVDPADTFHIKHISNAWNWISAGTQLGTPPYTLAIGREEEDGEEKGKGGSEEGMREGKGKKSWSQIIFRN